MEQTSPVEEPKEVMLQTDNPLLDMAIKTNERRKIVQTVMYSTPMKILATAILLSSLFAATFLVAYQTTQQSKIKAAMNEVPKAEIILPQEPIQKEVKVEQPKFCGGIAGLTCPEGYSCKLDGDYPDAGGSCVLEEAKPIDSETPVAP